MDGVIVDNHQFHFLAWQKLGAKYGIEITNEYYRDHMNGRTFSGIINAIFDRKITIAEAKAIAYEKEEIYRDLYRPSLAASPGLIDFLEAARSENIPMVVGTSAPIENVTFTLDGLKLRHFFQAVLDERAVTKGKPDPEIYLKCARAIQLAPSKCVVFEDAVSGIKAGQAAGAKVIALATSHSRDELESDLIVDSFSDIDLELINQVLHS